MKKAGLLIILALFVSSLSAQIITDKTSKKFSVGFDLYTDILTQTPADYDARTINQALMCLELIISPSEKVPILFRLVLEFALKTFIPTRKLQI